TTTKKNTKPTDKKSESETKSTPQNVEKPLKTEHYLYYLEGDFNNIFDFLKQVESFPYPIKITKLFFGTEEPNTETTTINKQTFNNREKLQLKFHLTLYFH
ncbi:MAG: hypothetical protein LBB88_05315, partial [Planctomycetaceae bacterium]|nr:hypothetical protein [Planctomycetaceae bacterium]